MMLHLQIKYGGQEQLVPVNGAGPWRIGRKAPCEIQVADKFVSSEHAELSCTSGIFKVRQIRGTNAIRFHGVDVDHATLQIGSRFRIGKTTFTLVESSSQSLDNTTLIDSQRVLAKGSENTSGSSVRMVRELTQALAESSNLGRLDVCVLELCCTRLGADRALLARPVEKDELEIFAIRGFHAETRVSQLISTTVLKKIMLEKQAALISDTASNDATEKSPSIGRNRIRAVACVPLMNLDGTLASVLYVDRLDRPAVFNGADAEFLIWIGYFYRLVAETIQLREHLQTQVQELKHAAANHVEMIAESPEILEILDLARRVAPATGSVLILGESGSGKECIANLLHRQSPRAKGPFVARNCAGIPENLFESEMFGHVRGAFTGALSDRKGAFLEAAGGTLFLDEIGEMHPALQVKLLRAINDKKVRPVGGSTDISVDVRIVSATNKDLVAAVNAKEFREDLYFRINTFILQMPPLRERPLDIVPIARYFVRNFSGGVRTLTSEAETRLLKHDWPGNVRELRSVIENAVFLAPRNEIQAADLSLPTKQGERIGLGNPPQTLADAERQHIARIVLQLNGNVSQAAKVLGIARGTLIVKLKEYRIQ